MKKLFFTLLLISSIVGVNAQNPQYLISQGGTVTMCGADFFDNGGGSANYGANRNDIITFVSNSPLNTHQIVNFNMFDVHPSDTLYIYDGPNISSPLIGKYNNSNSAAPFGARASVFNPSGALTFRFKSNASNQAAGWFATLMCTPQCQNIIAALDLARCHPTPVLENGIYYFNICQGDAVHFVANAGDTAFTQNDVIYHQDSTSSMFIWDFGDGIMDTATSAYHTYPLQVRGYDVTLLVRDVRGCFSTNSIGVRVRIAGNPLMQINPLPDICSGDSLMLSVGYNAGTTVNVNHIGAHQSASQRFDSTMFIPDGPSCPPGCYNTYVSFNIFAPGQRIQTANDVMSICVNMEHSFLGDLGFRIICPNGQSVQLDPNNHSGGGTFLGVPYGGANHGTYDSGCNPASNPFGEGWTYCWSQQYNTAPAYTIEAAGNACTTGTLDSTNRTNHSNFFYPANNLSGLIGCPLNGTWNIEICDDWGIDNGYIFYWDLNLSTNLLPQNWSYDVLLDTVQWSGPYMYNWTDSTVTIRPPDSTNTNSYTYNFSIVDEYGCYYDTSLTVDIINRPYVNLGPDKEICDGNNITLNAGGPYTSYLWSESSTTQTISVSVEGYYSVKVDNFNGTLTCTNNDTVYVTVHPTPAADFTVDLPEGCAPLAVHFINTTTPDIPYTYDWQLGDGTGSAAEDPTHIYPLYGSYTVSMRATSQYGCTDLETKTNYINVYAQPIANFTFFPINPDYEYPLVSFTDQSVDANSWLWNFGDLNSVTNISNIQNPMHSFSDTGTYTVTLYLMSDHGCHDSISKIVNVRDIFAFFIPSAFSPNGDGLNDRIGVSGVNIDVEGFDFKIFDRWGSVIFHTTDINEEWNGAKDNTGTALPADTYIYKVLIKDKRNSYYKKSGTITIL